jgi:hypothetical protein
MIEKAHSKFKGEYNILKNLESSTTCSNLGLLNHTIPDKSNLVRRPLKKTVIETD